MSLQVEVRWDRPSSVGTSEHWLAVRIGELWVEQRPASLAVLIDTSTSMLGEPLAAARKAVAGLVRASSPAERVAAYAFSSDVRTVAQGRGGEDFGPALAGLVAGGRTRLDLALDTAVRWLKTAGGAPHLVILTDGDPTDETGRRADPEAILARARDLGARGVRCAVVALGSAEKYDAGLMRAVADACGGTCLVGVPAAELPTRLLHAVRAAATESLDLAIDVESAELQVVEAWRSEPRVQPLPVVDAAIRTPAAPGGNSLLLHFRFTAAIGAPRGRRGVGVMKVRLQGHQVDVPLSLNLVSPGSRERDELNLDVDRQRVAAELARTAALRAETDDAGDQLRLTRNLADLVATLGDPRVTWRIDQELRQLGSGHALERDAMESTVTLLRTGGTDA